ncbi:MAG: hypothetical protein ACE5JB_15800 [bacterium]
MRHGGSYCKKGVGEGIFGLPTIATHPAIPQRGSSPAMSASVSPGWIR